MTLVVIPEKPKVKGRPRMTRSGRTYTPKDTLEAEANLRGYWPDEPVEGPVEVAITYHPNGQTVEITPSVGARTKGLRGDLDNYVKLTLDALNKVAFVDDKQVVKLTARFSDKAL